MSSHIPDHDSVREQLSAAATGHRGGAALSRSAITGGRAFASAVGILIAGFLLAVIYIFPTGFSAASIGVIAAYGLGLVVAIGLHRRNRASGLGWKRRYTVGAAVSISLYAVGVA